MRLTFPIEKKKNEARKSLYNLVEIMWHTILPLLFLFVGIEYNLFICVFILFSFFRLRPEAEDL